MAPKETQIAWTNVRNRLIAVASIACCASCFSQGSHVEAISYAELLTQVKSISQAERISATSFDGLRGWLLADVIEHKANQYDEQKFFVDSQHGHLEVDASTSRVKNSARVSINLYGHQGCLDSQAILVAFGKKTEINIVMHEFYPNQRDQSAEVLSNRERFGPGPYYRFIDMDGVKTGASFSFGFNACATSISITRGIN